MTYIASCINNTHHMDTIVVSKINVIKAISSAFFFFFWVQINTAQPFNRDKLYNNCPSQ